MTNNTEQQAVTVAQEARRVALIERIGTIADQACSTPLAGELGDVAYDLLRQAAAQISSDRQHIARLASVSSASADIPKPAEIGGLLEMTKRDVEKEGAFSSTMVRAGLLVNILDELYAHRARSNAALDAPAASPEPVPATNQAGEVALRAGDRVKFATGEAGEIIRCDYVVQLDEPDGSQGAMGGSVGIWTVDASELTRAALATQPATSRQSALANMTAIDDEIDASHPGWMTGQPATSQEGEACEHEAYLVDTADQPTRCVDCGASVSDLAATPTPPTLSEDLRAAVAGIADDYMTSEAHHPGYVLIPTAKFEELSALARAQVKAS